MSRADPLPVTEVDGEVGMGPSPVMATPVLVISRGPRTGECLRLDHEVTTVGRHADSWRFVSDVTVSRRHAEFRRAGILVTVYDLGSATGTYVNGARVQHAELRDGDQVQIGSFQFTYSGGPAPDGVSGGPSEESTVSR